MAATALKGWELENAVQLVDSHRDALYKLDEPRIKALDSEKPWRKNPSYFTAIRISSVALLKMTMHARSGGQLEVMGLMMGYVAEHTFVVTDAFRLPVEGTETRVNAQSEADEYLVKFFELARESGQMENAVGWYHSHPGYGCWLSGIDVSTQNTWQQFQDPFVAVVIDPDRTISAGKVEIGAFRTYPEGHTASSQQPAEVQAGVHGDPAGTDSEGFQTVPLAKMEDFGAHAERYYSLEVSHFKSSLDTKVLEALWNKYWVSTLSSSPLFSNRDFSTSQMAELARKIKQLDSSVQAQNRSGGSSGMFGFSKGDAGKRDDRLEKVVAAGRKIASEEEAGLMSKEIKEKLFGGLGYATPPAESATAQ